MNIRELIEKLQELDPEMMVVVDGYEDGTDTINSFDIVRIPHNARRKFYARYFSARRACIKKRMEVANYIVGNCFAAALAPPLAVSTRLIRCTQ